MRGADGPDSLFGLEGNDDLDGEGNLDTLEGGLGDDADIVSFSHSKSPIVANIQQNRVAGRAMTSSSAAASSAARPATT